MSCVFAFRPPARVRGLQYTRVARQKADPGAGHTMRRSNSWRSVERGAPPCVSGNGRRPVQCIRRRAQDCCSVSADSAGRPLRRPLGRSWRGHRGRWCGCRRRLRRVSRIRAASVWAVGCSVAVLSRTAVQASIIAIGLATFSPGSDGAVPCGASAIATRGVRSGLSATSKDSAPAIEPNIASTRSAMQSPSRLSGGMTSGCRAMSVTAPAYVASMRIGR